MIEGQGAGRLNGEEIVRESKTLASSMRPGPRGPGKDVVLVTFCSKGTRWAVRFLFALLIAVMAFPLVSSGEKARCAEEPSWLTIQPVASKQRLSPPEEPCRFKEVVRKERVLAKTRYVKMSSFRSGFTQVRQHSRDGVKEVRIAVCLIHPNHKKVLGQRVVRPARDEVIAVQGSMNLASRGGYFRGRAEITMVATGYPAGVTGTWRTYLGTRAQKGVVAVDPRHIPFGTRMYVEGYGPAVAADIGSAIKGNRIDLCFDSQREADRYGVKRVRVRFLSRCTRP